MGASVQNYLLEKSRVAKYASVERNYHIFYEMVAGAAPSDRLKYRLLKTSKDYRYLNFAATHEVAGHDDAKEYDSLRRALLVLNMSLLDMEAMFKLLAAILLLGNVEFDGADAVSIKGKDSETHIKHIAELLAMDENQLRQLLCQRKLSVGKEITVVPLKKEQVCRIVDPCALVILL